MKFSCVVVFSFSLYVSSLDSITFYKCDMKCLSVYSCTFRLFLNVPRASAHSAAGIILVFVHWCMSACTCEGITSRPGVFFEERF